MQDGSGRDIVLIHGSFATGQDWTSGSSRAVTELGRVTVIDRPGHGGSHRPRLDGSPAAQADRIAAGLAALSVERPIIVGHSFGALVALTYARTYPVEGLVLASPMAFPELRPVEHALFAPRAAPLFGPLFAWPMAGTLDRLLLEMMHRLMFAPGAPPAEWRATYPWGDVLSPAGTVANGEDMLAIHPLLAPTSEWSDVKTPTVVISGTADLVIDDRRQACPLAEQLPNATHIRIPGAGHMLHHSHRAELLGAVKQLT